MGAGKRVGSYINNSGGLDGKIQSIVVELPNGFTKRKRWYNNPKVLPNSKIYVYAKPEKLKMSNSERWDKVGSLMQTLGATLTTLLMVQTLMNNSN